MLCALAICLSALSPAGKAHAETRTLKLKFVHTGEKASITYKKNGQYIKSGLQQINRILRDFRRNEPTNMDTRLIDLVWEVYQASGSKDYIHVISAYRSPATNSMLRGRGRGVAKNSQHMLGKAMDFFIPDVKLSRLREIGLKMGVGGVGFYPTSGSPFVHLDVGSVRHWPRMSRQELARVFPDGKTLHVPTDGKPLPRYEQALAEYKKRGRTSAVTVASVEETKKPNFFQMLAARAKQDQADDEGADEPVVASAAPVKGAGERPAELRAAETPAPPAPAVPAARPAPAATPDPDRIRQLAEREGKPVEIASLIAGEKEEEEVRIKVPVPQRRPEYAPVVVAAAAPAPGSETGPSSEIEALIADAAQAETGEDKPAAPVVVAALTPAEIEEIRRIAIPTQNPQAQRAAAPPQPDAPPAATRTAASTTTAGPAPTASVGSELALLPANTPVPSPLREAPLGTSPQATASVSAVERLANGLPMPTPVPNPATRQAAPQPQAQTAAAEPASQRPQGASRRTVEMALAATPRNDDKAIRAIRELAALENRAESGNSAAGVPVPSRNPQHEMAVARTDRVTGPGRGPGRGNGTVDGVPVKIAQVQARDTVDAGKYALSTTRSLENVAEIKAPGYSLAPAVDDRTMMVAAFVQARLQAPRRFDTRTATLPGIRFER